MFFCVLLNMFEKLIQVVEYSCSSFIFIANGVQLYDYTAIYLLILLLGYIQFGTNINNISEHFLWDICEDISAGHIFRSETARSQGAYISIGYTAKWFSK